MQTSSQWLAYFQHNAGNLLDIPWERGGELTDAEKRVVRKSVQEFQAGESSEGRHIFKYAKEYVETSGDEDYMAALRLFIAEEHRHARDLARFLGLNDIPTVKTTFADSVFRKLRNLVGSLEISIAVLILAEIIAKVYYKALKQATGSVILDKLCEQILSDEEQHVEFQAQQLGKLRWRRRMPARVMTTSLERFLFFGTCIVVWLVHGGTFRRGGYGFFAYWRACWWEFNNAAGICDRARLAIRYQRLEVAADGPWA